jgi:two-component system chemotaxis sensor kinase CheA
MDAYLSDDMYQEMLADFLDESGQLLDRLGENLLSLDEWIKDHPPGSGDHFDGEILNEMFRAAHSLKGLSAMLNLTNINQLTHRLENLFDAVRKGELVVEQQCVDLMFQATDRLRAMVDLLRTQNSDAIDAQDIVSAIAAILEGRHSGPSLAEARANEALLKAETALAEALNEAPQQGSETPSTNDQQSSPGNGQSQYLEEAAARFRDVRDEADLSSSYIALFIDELAQGLDTLTETLLEAEGSGTSSQLENLLCTAHRIKGSAASVGFHRASKLAHLMEDILQGLRETGKPLTPELNDVLLKCTDGFRAFLDQLRQGRSQCDVDFVGLAARLLACAAALENHPTGTQSQQPAMVNETGRKSELWPSAELLQKARELTGAGFVGRVEFQPNLDLSGLKARLLHEKLCHLGTVVWFSPPQERLEEIERVEMVDFILETTQPAEVVSRGIRVGGVREIRLQPFSQNDEAGGSAGKTPVSTAQCTETQGQASSQSERSVGNNPATQEKGRVTGEVPKAVETLRVDIERLDQLMNLAGQLVITRARLTELTDKLKFHFHENRASQIFRGIRDLFARMACLSGGNSSAAQTARLDGMLIDRLEKEFDALAHQLDVLAEARIAVNYLTEAVHQLERVTDGIQRAVMETRMVPIGPLFNRFKRVVRDVTRLNGKNIQLVINGEKTELDKRMIDELGDPLIHLVRNAADHGIEAPDVRRQLGKPEQGTITLNAFHRGNSIVIQVSDDGKGLDTERILKKALDRNLITAGQAEKMSRQEIFQLIFLPGLSTAEKVTEVSGRGMGMDIVKAKIEELSGTIELDSVPGAGTTVTIKLPLTLAILPSLLVQVDGDVFAMPIEAVNEIVAVRGEHLVTVHGLRTARVRERIISVVELPEIFGGMLRCSRVAAEKPRETTLVILGDTDHEIGLVVDRVLGEEDVVIKSIAENYRNIPGIAGASILGNGRVSLILDVTAIIGMVTRQMGAHAM